MKLYNLKKLVVTVIVSIVFLLGTTSAQAASFELDFTADFTSGPLSSISGTIIYEADSIDSYISSLTSIDLKIGDYVYSLSEVGFISPLSSSNRTIIGGTINSVGGVAAGNNDFWIRFYHIDRSPEVYDFLYTKSGATGNYQSLSFSKFSLTQINNSTSVPEPASLLLFGLGLIGLAGVRKRFNKQ